MTRPREILCAATEQLSAAGVGSPRVDAELLLAHCLDVERSRLALLENVDERTSRCFWDALRRRVAREPLQYIVGHAAFRHVELAVGPGVFVPRPETELLVDAALTALAARPAPVVVDLCAGSGALACSIARECPAATVYAVESMPGALPWLRRNCAPLGVTVAVGDVADPALLRNLRSRVDAVVSNPPYVPEAAAVSPEVRADPPQAVFAGPDGLAVIPLVIIRAATLLRPGGTLVVEHDDSHREAVPVLLREDGRWGGVADHDDLAGRPRYATAVRA